MTIGAGSGRLCSPVSIVLMPIRFWNPWAPLIFARHTSAIPPAARRESISYLLNSVPGRQGDGDAASAGTGWRGAAAGPASASGACLEDELLSSIARATSGVGG